MKKYIFACVMVVGFLISGVAFAKVDNPLINLEHLKGNQELSQLISGPQHDTFAYTLYLSGHMRWSWDYLFPESLKLFQTTNGLLHTEKLDEPTANALNQLFTITENQPEPSPTVPRMMSHWGALNMYWSIKDNKWYPDPTFSYGAAHDKLEFCRRVYPNTVALRPYAYEGVPWSDANGTVGETYHQISYECVQPEGQPTEEVPFTEGSKISWTQILDELKPNKKDPNDVAAVKQILTDEGVYNGNLNGTYNKQVDAAIARLKEKYQKLENTDPTFNSELKAAELEVKLQDKQYPFNGKIEKCNADGSVVYTVEPNAYDGGEVVLNNKLKETGVCNAELEGTVNPICEKVKKCTPIYVTDDNIWGEQPVYKPAVNKVLNSVINQYAD